MKLHLVLAAFLMSATSLSLAGTQSGTINALHIRASDGLIYFTLNGPKTGSPACAQVAYWMVKDENSAAGKRQYAALLAASAAGKTIHVSGSNTCTRWSDGEDVDQITIPA